MSRFTVLGASGFIGSRLVARLRERGDDVQAPSRDADLTGHGLGHVISCVGLTADFRTRPFDTVDAHVAHIANVLSGAAFESLLYLSTTRVYAGGEEAREDQALRANPANPDHLYNLSKMLGESLCLSVDRVEVRVARLSNVYGAGERSDNFLASLVTDAVEHGRINLRTSLDSAKDYVSVEDVVAVLPEIALHGAQRVYNVASGVNTTHGAITDQLVSLTGCRVTVAPGALATGFPVISIDRLRGEFDWRPRPVLSDLAALVTARRGALHA